MIIPIAAGLAAIAEPILAAAGIGALIGGGIGAVGGAVSGVQEHGTFNSEAAIVTVHSAAEGAAEGALVGGAFGAVGVAAAPIMPAAGAAAQPALGLVDDIVRPIIGAIDDIARLIIGAVDDLVSPVLRQFGLVADDVASCSIGGCLYVMDDAAHAISKIGITNNPARRIGEVQRQVGSKLNYVGVMPVDDARAAERAWHQHFVNQNVRHPNHLQGTEWFRLSASDKAFIFAR